MIPRHITQKVLDALFDTPVVLINGARQTGKSTLVQWIAREHYPAQYVSLDDLTVLAVAKEAPQDFVFQLNKPVIIDEVQRAPGLFLAIKAAVDKNRQPGQFILTGSSNVMLLPQLAQYLVGRMEILTLLPFSQGEIEGRKERFVDFIFQKGLQFPQIDVEAVEPEYYLNRLIRGGYPEMLTRKTPARRRAWVDSYITTLLHRDIRDLSKIENFTALPRLLQLLAARVMSLVNFSELSRVAAIPQSTLKRYLSLLQATFLIHLLPSWSTNLGKRVVKAPKLMFNDTAIVSHLRGFTNNNIPFSNLHIGPVMENFVVMELYKQITWSGTYPHTFHFRTTAGKEVDILLENTAGEIVGIEVKAGTQVSSKDFSGLKLLSELLGKRFLRGVLFYTGEHVLSFGKNLFAVPLHYLWTI